MIYIDRNDYDNRDIAYNTLIETSLDFLGHLDVIQPYSGADVLKEQSDALNIRSDSLETGRAHINYYCDKLLDFLRNGTVGLEKNYAKYDGSGVGNYKQIYDYYTGKGQTVPAALAKYIVPPNKIATRMTLDASNLTAYYGDVVTISGKLSYQNGTGIPDSKISMMFNNRTFFTTTNETGVYVFNLSINGSINMNSYKIYTIYSGLFAGDTFLMNSRSPELAIMLELQSVYMTINCPQQTFEVGDNVILDGVLTAQSGLPVAGANVSVFVEEPGPTATRGSDLIIGNSFTDLDGHYLISFLIPDDMSTGNRDIYTAYTWPSTSLIHAINSSKVSISVIATKPVFIFNPIPLVYFQNDIIGVKGHLTTPNGHNISGQEVDVNLQGVDLDTDYTDDTGMFILSWVVSQGDKPCLQTVSLQTPGNDGTILGNSATVCTIIVLPYDRTIFTLATIVILLSVIAVALAVVKIKKRSNRKKRQGKSCDSNAKERR